MQHLIQGFSMWLGFLKALSTQGSHTSCMMLGSRREETETVRPVKIYARTSTDSFGLYSVGQSSQISCPDSRERKNIVHLLTEELKGGCRCKKKQEERRWEQGPSPMEGTSLLMMNCMEFLVSFFHNVLSCIVSNLWESLTCCPHLIIGLPGGLQ